MSLEALQDYVFVSKYARYLPRKKRRETFDEAVDRVISMHKKHLASLGKLECMKEELDEVETAMKARLVLGSQRALQFGGPPVLKKHARSYNCTTSYCDRPRFFQECMWLLLCGCGAGFSVQTHHVEKLPELSPPKTPIHKNVYVIPDSIEGWSNSIGILLASYGLAAPEFVNSTMVRPGTEVHFDFSEIRPKGAPLSSSGGKAPGPAGLRRSLEKIRHLLDRCIANNQQRLRPIDAYDIVMHASDAVLSGGVRRSATICIFSKHDNEMRTAKTGNWFSENPQRGRSNNSVMLIRGATTKKEFTDIMHSVREFGEPGFVWADDTEIVYNPCCEIGLLPTIDGESGWAFCNLSEINGKACTSLAVWKQAARAAAILGTIQASYTKFSYLPEVSERICKRESLLGVSITGIMDNPDLLLNPAKQREVAKYVVKTNETMAKKLGINAAARTTCTKPSGSASCILGTASGIHPHHSSRYFRRAQANDMEEPLRYLEKHNPMSVEKSVWNPNGTDKVVTFCIETDPNARTKEDVDAIDLLESVMTTQNNWVSAGRVASRCAAPFLRHNVSNTISVKDDEWRAVENFIYENRDSFAGVSLLPYSGDRDYQQAPFCQVFDPDEIVTQYGSGALFASGLIVDAISVYGTLWAACDAAQGLGSPLNVNALRAKLERDYASNMAGAWEVEGLRPDSPAKLLRAWLGHNIINFDMKSDWVRRARKFAKNYFKDDLQIMSYCLKDVQNWKVWCDITRAYVPINWAEFYEVTDNTAVEDTTACAGGSCDIL